MILRRPYAFLVKHFRIIHLLLLLCSGFLLYKTFSIVSFFGTYIKNSGSIKNIEDVASTYVTLPMYLIAVFISLLSGIIIYLLKYKKKPILVYIITSIFYIVLFISFVLLSSFLYDLQFNNPSIRLINIIRDAYRFTILIQIAALVLFFIRTIGFDLTKFDFKKDLLDLGIENVDNEEYEFELKVDREDLKSKVHKKIRYFKYFYKENKFIFIFIGLVVLVVCFSFLIKIILGREKIYKEGQSISFDNFNMKVLESYKTNTTSSGDKLNSKYFYIIAKIEFQNKTNYEYSPGIGLFNLSYNEYDSTSPITSENSKFTEFGVNYFSQTLKARESRVFNLIFEIPMEYYKENFVINYLAGAKYNNNQVEYNYKKIKLSPKEFSEEKKNISSETLGNELNFKGSILGNTKISIYDIELNDLFSYNLYKCSNSVCETRKKTINASISDKFDLTIMKIHYNIDFDYNALGTKYSNDLFISRFGTIRFEINGKEYNNRIELKDVTPLKTDNYAFIEVRDKLKDADKIYLDFTIRDKIYTYIIRDNTQKEGE